MIEWQNNYHLKSKYHVPGTVLMGAFKKIISFDLYNPAR